MIEIKTNPVITISKNDIETLKTICSIALKSIEKGQAMPKEDIENELDLTSTSYTHVCAMIRIIRDA